MRAGGRWREIQGKWGYWGGLLAGDDALTEASKAKRTDQAKAVIKGEQTTKEANIAWN